VTLNYVVWKRFDASFGRHQSGGCWKSTVVLRLLNYCNSVLAELPKSTTAPLQRVQNATVMVRLIAWCWLNIIIWAALASWRATCESNCKRAPHSYRMQPFVSFRTSHVGRQYRVLVSNDGVDVHGMDCSQNSPRREQPATHLKLDEQSFAFTWNSLSASLFDIARP
jgi:hypothetical protein